MVRRRVLAAIVIGMSGVAVAACGTTASLSPSPSSTGPSTTVTTIPPTTTTTCPLSAADGSSVSVPVDSVCSSTGAPHFATPDQAMQYLAAAWNAGNVQEIDYVTDPAGRAQMDSMASLMVDLRFDSCSQNPAGDYTCYFTHDIVASTSPTTYPNPNNYPPGEAVFTVAPADAPGWYLTQVIHCG